MELLIIFIIISVLEKIFKTKKDQKNIQEARKKRMEANSPSQSQTQNKTQKQPQTERKKPKSFADKIKEEIEKGYESIEKGMESNPNIGKKKDMKPSESRRIKEKPVMKKTKKIEYDDRYITDYDAAYEVYDGKGTLEGKEYQDGRYITEYDKPYETYGRKTGTQEGRSYKKRDEDFYKRREKKIPIMDEESGISIEDQIVMGFIYSEILGKPKSKR